ncbi:hypothetical protein [Kineosporia babensis]|uniref:Uncharacterized protein n=1 Tax=Kineosporia babensis TaxID=499548 RepID=A0A9X1N6V0_9ACTN|nr:hypothetical protein [Kineosporia babensis]MCD5309452.1 hypothetical protein [Kineosporia babensis]
MNDRELDELLRGAQPRSAAEVPLVAPALHQAGQDLLETIMSVPESSYPEPEDLKAEEVVLIGVRRRPPRRSWWLLGAAAAVAVVLAVALPMQFFGRDTAAVEPAGVVKKSGTPGLPQEPLTGDGMPYFLMDNPDWKTAGADSDDIGYSTKGARLSIQYKKGSSVLEEDGTPTISTEMGMQPITIFGRPGAVWDRSKFSDRDGFELYFRHAGLTAMVYGDGLDTREQFYAAIADLKQVSEEEFMASLPDSHVLPDDKAATIQELLADVKVPDGFKAVSVPKEGPIRLSVLADDVVLDVGCAWADVYLKAQKNQDAAGVARAVEAMQGSRDWTAMDKIYGIVDKEKFFETADWMAEGRKMERSDMFGALCEYR